jgi:type IV secretory pathway VirB2 component (pilin)
MWFLKNRLHLVSLALILTLLLSLTQTEFARESSVYNGHSPSVVTWAWASWFENVRFFLLGYLAHFVAPLIFLVLFFPAQNQKTPKRA